VILWILLIITIFALIVISCILFSTIAVSADGFYSDDSYGFCYKVWWIHKSVISFKGEYPSDKTACYFFGKKILGDDKTADPQNESAPINQSAEEKPDEKPDKEINPGYRDETQKTDSPPHSSVDEPVAPTDTSYKPAAASYTEETVSRSSISTASDVTQDNPSSQHDTGTAFEPKKIIPQEINTDYPRSDHSTSAKPEAPKQTIKQKITDLKEKAVNSRAMFFLRQKKLIRKTIKCVELTLRSCLRILKFDNLTVYVKCGLPDHAVTGMIYGFFTGIKGMAGCCTHSRVSFGMEPVFGNATVFEGKGSVCIKTSIWRLIFPAIVFLATLPYITALITWLRYRRRYGKKEKKGSQTEA
jgi:hypothetical protein